MRESSFSNSGTKIKDVLSWESNPFLKMAAEIAGFHHEQWQGKGYPFGVQGEKIPMVARIVTISDVYDALRSVRVYKPAIQHEEALAIMREENGIRFDPGVFSVFEQCLPEFIDIHRQYYDS